MKLRQFASPSVLLLLGASFLLNLSAPTHLFSQEEGSPEKAKVEQTSEKPTSDDKAQEPAEQKPAEAVEENEESEPAAKKAETPITALVGGTIMTFDQAGVIEDGVILIQDQKILDVGDNSIEIPENATKIDVSGTIITPGLIDTQSTMWLEAGSRSAYASDAGLRVVDGLDPFDRGWESILKQGVTAAYVQPSNRGFLGGPGAVVSTYPKSATEVEILKSDVSVQMALGARASDNRARQSEIARVKKVFDGVKDYQKKWDAYRKYEEEQKKKKAGGEKNKPSAEDAKGKDDKAKAGEKSEPKSEDDKAEAPVRGRPSGSRPSGRRPGGDEKPVDTSGSDKGTAGKSGSEKKESGKEEKAPEKPDLDEDKELLVKVIEGKIPLRVEIQNADDFFYATELFENDVFDKTQIVYQGLSDLGSAASQFKQLRQPAVLGPWLSLGGPDAAIDNRLTMWAEQFGEYEGTVSISSGGETPSDTRQLRAHAASAVAAGMPADRVLKSITSDAAKLLGLSDMLGSITKGKRADLVCFRGNPLDTASPVQSVVIAGEVVIDQSEDKLPPASLAMTTGEEAAESELPAILPKSFALRSRRVWQGGKLEERTILIENGKIASVEALDFELADSRPVFDLGTKPITPGLFSAHTLLGITGAVDPNNQVDASYVTSSVALANAKDRVENLVSKGLLAAIVAPGNANPIAGQANLVRFTNPASTTTEDVLTKFVMSNDARSRDRFPSSLAGQSQLISQNLNGEPVESNIYLPDAVNARLVAKSQEMAKGLVSGKRLALFVAESDAEAMAALDLIERFKLRAAIAGLKQIAPFLDRLKSLNVAVIVQPIQADAYEWYANDLSDAVAKGITISFAGESPEQLRFSAACAIQAGMPVEMALNALCSSRNLTSGPEAAPLTEGAMADLVIWSNSPTNLSATPLHVIIDGKSVSEKDK